jgi:peptidyl-prolyl cis-trans isomerase B (cyclophilin B)
MIKECMAGILFFIFLVTLTSCGDSSNERFQKAYQQNLKKSNSKDSLSANNEALKDIAISDRNVKDVLTRYGKENPETQVLIRTRLGNIKLRLYEDTPLHRANFIRLAKRKFYDEGEFNRVIKDFMIQGGDSDDRKMSISRYMVPMESNPKYFHKKGALAMAKLDSVSGSSSHYFFIVHGVKLKNAQLDVIAKEYNLNFTPQQRKAYTTVGGVPQLDGKYTVFGEVIEGFNVIDKIAAVKTDREEWPLEEIDIKMEVLK